MSSGGARGAAHRPIGGTFQKRVERGKGTRSPYPDGEQRARLRRSESFPMLIGASFAVSASQVRGQWKNALKPLDAA